MRRKVIRMSDRERLVELMRKGYETVPVGGFVYEGIADYLLANGVILPPCKAGDTVYVISRYYTGTWQIYSCTVEYITKYKSNSFINAVFSRDINFGLNIVEFGKTVFLTRKEAEKALAERSGKQ